MKRKGSIHAFNPEIFDIICQIISTSVAGSKKVQPLVQGRYL